MAVKWETVKIFISSTFDDMHAEPRLSGQAGLSGVARVVRETKIKPGRYRFTLGSA